MFFLTSFTQNCLRLCDKVLKLFLLNFKQFKVSNLNSQIFVLPSATAALEKKRKKTKAKK